jgi:hypothetical protein
MLCDIGSLLRQTALQVTDFGQPPSKKQGNAFLPTTLMSPVFDVVNGGQKNLPYLPD